MKIDVQTFEGLDRPCYIVEERLLRRNLELISRVASEAGIEIILAFKAFALWKTFSHISRIYHINHSQFSFRGSFGFRGVWLEGSHFFAGL